MKATQVKVLVPYDADAKQGIVSGAGTRVFINGIEFENLEHIKYSTEVGVNEVVKSTITLTFAGDILVERNV